MSVYQASSWCLLGTVLSCASPAELSAAAGIPATVVTLKGESVEGRFIGASDTELTIDTPGRRLTLSLRDVSYVSFAGRPPSAEAVSYTKPESRSAQLRMEGSVSETAGRLDEALGKYKEAAKLDPADPKTIAVLQRVRRRMSALDGAKRAAPYKKLAVELKGRSRYPEAAACYDEAMRLDPLDENFKISLAPIRDNWLPSTCPVPVQP